MTDITETPKTDTGVTAESEAERRKKEAYFTASQMQLVWARFRKQRAAMIAELRTIRERITALESRLHSSIEAEPDEQELPDEQHQPRGIRARRPPVVSISRSNWPPSTSVLRISSRCLRSRNWVCRVKKMTEEGIEPPTRGL